MTGKNEPNDMKRREFIGRTVLAAGAASVAPGILLTVANAKSEGEGASSDIRWGMLIDSNKCVDNCTACVDACERENGINLLQRPEGQGRRDVECTASAVDQKSQTAGTGRQMKSPICR